MSGGRCRRSHQQERRGAVASADDRPWDSSDARRRWNGTRGRGGAWHNGDDEEEFVCALTRVDGKTAEWKGERGNVGGTTTTTIDRNNDGGGCGVNDRERRPSSSLGRLRNLLLERSSLAIVTLRGSEDLPGYGPCFSPDDFGVPRAFFHIH